VVIPPELAEANITQDSARLSIQSAMVPEFVLWYLRSEIAQARMRSAVKGVAVRGLNIGDVLALQVPIPSRPEQQEIVRRVEILLSYACNFESFCSRAIGDVARLVPSALSKGFRGELVPQDPNDEPASALLERIRTAREEAGQAPATRRPKSQRSTIEPKKEIIMLTRKEVPAAHLAAILKSRGPLSAEALWNASNLGIDDFYDVLREEESQGLLKEIRDDNPNTPRTLEAA
jgi:type I restriction enzyme, S subunit